MSELRKFTEELGVAQLSVPAIYIHFPFCRSICPFCDFAVYPYRVGNRKREYLRLLGEEIKTIGTYFFSSPVQPLQSLYFGGGTPSLMETDEVSRTLEQIRALVSLESAQISFEVNPEDASESYLRQLRDVGINRISFGAQSFSADALGVLGRKNSPTDNLNAIRHAKTIGLEYNVDLMFGYKGQTREGLRADLHRLIACEPHHVSVYCLSLEPGTKVHRDESWRNWQEQHEDLIVDSYFDIIAHLQAAGIEQYEVSNFSRPGLQSRQNLLNWDGRYYLGFGVSAHSYVAGRRWSNPKRLSRWKQSVTQGILAHEFFEELTPEQKTLERIMIGIRRKSGLRFDEAFTVGNNDPRRLWAKKIKLFSRLELLRETKDGIVLTPKGLLMADTIATELSAEI